MARIQSTGPHRNIAIALVSLGIAIPLSSYFVTPNGAFSPHPEAPDSIRLSIQAEVGAFMAELERSDAAMQEASKR